MLLGDPNGGFVLCKSHILAGCGLLCSGDRAGLGFAGFSVSGCSPSLSAGALLSQQSPNSSGNRAAFEGRGQGPSTGCTACMCPVSVFKSNLKALRTQVPSGE